MVLAELAVMQNNWLFDKRQLKDTPSCRDGVDYEMEVRYRREGARFVSEVGTRMNLRYDTMATGVVYFHRFFMFHSFKDFSRYTVALGCLFLAGKVEETPKKCKDIVAVAREVLTEDQFSVAFGDDPKEEMITIERILLQTIHFDLQVEHPYEYLLKYAKVLRGDKGKIQHMVQMAWTFVNDSLCTVLCLQWEPEIIAIALMYLASRLSKFEVLDWFNRKGVKSEKWWDQFVDDLSMDLLEEICHQVLDLYSSKGTGGKKGSATSNAARAAAKFTGSGGAAAAMAGTFSSAASSTTGAVPIASGGATMARSDATKLPAVVPTLASAGAGGRDLHTPVGGNRFATGAPAGLMAATPGLPDRVTTVGGVAGAAKISGYGSTGGVAVPPGITPGSGPALQTGSQQISHSGYASIVSAPNYGLPPASSAVHAPTAAGMPGSIASYGTQMPPSSNSTNTSGGVSSVHMTVPLPAGSYAPPLPPEVPGPPVPYGHHPPNNPPGLSSASAIPPPLPPATAYNPPPAGPPPAMYHYPPAPPGAGYPSSVVAPPPLPPPSHSYHPYAHTAGGNNGNGGLLPPGTPGMYHQQQHHQYAGYQQVPPPMPPPQSGYGPPPPMGQPPPSSYGGGYSSGR